MLSENHIGRACKDLELATIDDEVELGQLSQVSLEEFTALLDRVLVILSGESLLREESNTQSSDNK